MKYAPKMKEVLFYNLTVTSSVLYRTAKTNKEGSTPKPDNQRDLRAGFLLEETTKRIIAGRSATFPWFLSVYLVDGVDFLLPFSFSRRCFGH